MAIAAHHDEIRVPVRRIGQDHVGDVYIAPIDSSEFDVRPVAGEVLHNIGALDFVRVVLNGADGRHIDLLGTYKKGHGIVDRACGIAAAIPADHDAVKLDAGTLNIGYNQNRPSGIEQGAFN